MALVARSKGSLNGLTRSGSSAETSEAAAHSSTRAAARNPADTADPALPVRWCVLQAAPGQEARPFARHERSTGPFMSGLSPLEEGGRRPQGVVLVLPEDPLQFLRV